MKYASLLTLVVLATGCSVGSFSGSVAGTTFTPKDAVTASAHFSARNDSYELPAMTFGLVYIGSTDNICDDVTNHITRENAKGVLFGLISIGDSGLHPAKGDYVADPNAITAALLNGTSGKFSIGAFQSGDSNCKQSTSLDDGAGDISAGKVILDSADSSGAHGSYAVTFGGNDKVTGNFSATDCAGLQDTVTTLAGIFGYRSAGDANTVSNPNVACKP